MDLTNPMLSVVPNVRGAVLSVLARTDEPLSGRRVAELARPRFAQSQVNRVLQKLAASGVVVRESRPPANIYRLNHDHVAAEGVVALGRMWSTLITRIRAELDSWPIAPRAAWLFGSAARGEGTEASDIDIFLLTPSGLDSETTARVWDDQTDDLATKIKSWSGNACEVMEMDEVELSAAVARNDRLIREIREQAVVLAGSDPRALLRGSALG